MFVRLFTKLHAPLAIPVKGLIANMRATPLQLSYGACRWSSSNPGGSQVPGQICQNHQVEQQPSSNGGNTNTTTNSATCEAKNPPQTCQQPYQTVKDRGTPQETTNAQSMHETAVRPHTQPSHVLYNASTDLSRLSNASQQTQQQQQRQFAASKTYRSLTMPLKSSRLANPFPEPVKLMPSCQVSDQEKAQRMYNDSRLPGGRQ